jgi:sigma-B regulation protein RsbU (phosphoserine phosphatase)
MKTDSRSDRAAADSCRIKDESERQMLIEKIAALSAENQALRTRLQDIESQPRQNSGHNAEEARKTLQLAEYIIDHSPAILFRRLAAEKLEERKMVYVSPNISRFGYRAEDLLSNKIMFRDFVYPGDRERITEEIDEYVRQGRQRYSQYYRIVTKEGQTRWVEDRTSVVEDASGTRYHQGIVIDIHKRKEAEERLRKSEEKYRRIVDTTGEGFVLMNDALQIVDHNTAFAALIGRADDDLFGTAPLARIVETHSLLPSAEADAAAGSEYREIECELPTASGATIPVLLHSNTLRSDTGAVIGIMAFITDMTEQKKAISLAGEVQRSLLPSTPPDIAGFDIAGCNQACEEVGGDYFDYLFDPRDSNRLSVVVGDITGHGVDSALLMTSARGFLRMRASQPGSMVDIVTAMNRHLTEDVHHTGRFMTLFYLGLDHRANRAHWIRAGHDPGLLYDPKKDCFTELKGPGLALGVDADYPFSKQAIEDLQPEQIFILTSDGLWEARNEAQEMYGRERLKACIRHHVQKNRGDSAEHLMQAILKNQHGFCGSAKLEDDVTLVVVRVTANA